MESLGRLIIPGALKPLPGKVSSETDMLLRQMKPAQLLKATVLGTTPTGIARLRIGNSELNARAPASLETGQRLLLRVEKGLPQPLLRIMQTPAGADPARQLQRHAMARQVPPQEITSQARTLQQQVQRLPATTRQRLPVLAQALQALNPPAADIARLTSTHIRRAVQDSGLFLEPLLGRQGATPDTDRKLQLLQLLQRLKPENRGRSDPAIPRNGERDNGLRPAADQLMNRLMRLVEGGIARIQHHQTLSLNAAEQSSQGLWRVDLPLQVNGQRDHLELTIQRDGGRDDDDSACGATWKIEVRFDFRELGQVLSRIMLDGTRVHCAFWSDLPETAARFERALPRLEQALRHAGLEVSAASSLHGKPQTGPAQVDRLLSERV